MEFAIDVQSKIQVFPRKMEITSNGPGGERGIQWVSQYGYLGVTCFGLNVCLDGMNEKGLSFGYLWMPTTQYQAISASDAEKPLDFVDFGAWVLGNFATIADVKEGLKGVRVWGHPIPSLMGLPPLHAAIHDAGGNHLVIEFMKGEMKIYDNPNTVLTNYPPFDWMTINLQNYINLNSFNIQPVKYPGSVVGQTGQGSGFLGIPGDWTPPSRFVRMTTYLRFVERPQNAFDTVNLAEHLLNTVDIPLGLIRNRIQSGGSEDFTQWVVAKDQTN
jgi:choloylglycine hydrolase